MAKDDIDLSKIIIETKIIDYLNKDHSKFPTKYNFDLSDILAQQREEQFAQSTGRNQPIAGVDWSDPVSIKQYLDAYVHGQDDAKVALSTAFADYVSHGISSVSLLVGPSGSGKTYMATLLCRAAGIPFVEVSMANITGEGYKGANLTQKLNDLAGKEKGLVLFDEIDKIADSRGESRVGFQSKLQDELLGIFSGLPLGSSGIFSQKIDTSRFMYITAGAFQGGFGHRSLASIIQRRLGGNMAMVSETQLLENINDADLIEYGFKPELVGRLSRKSVLHPLTEGDYYEILKNSEESIINRMTAHFRDNLGINISFDDEALRMMAGYAALGVGVRGLESAVERVLQPLSFNRKEHKGQTVVIDAAYVNGALQTDPRFVEPDTLEVNWTDPNSIVDYLDIYVKGQDDAKRNLSTAFYLYNQSLQTGVRLPQSNLLMVGPSGSGKTYMVDTLASKANLPVFKMDASTGLSLSQQMAQFGEMERGIIYIDEIDKILLNPQDPRNNELLGIAGSGKYLVIGSGAFQDMYEQGQKRELGFGTSSGETPEVSLSHEQLIHYGMKTEVIGRFPIIANLHSLDAHTLVDILNSETSVIGEYLNLFNQRGQEVMIEEDALYAMADIALQYGTGARALKTVADRVFMPYISQIEGNIEITEESVLEVYN